MRRNSLFLRIYVSFILFLVMPVVVLGLVLRANLVRSYQQEVTDSRLANLEAVRSRADGFLRDLRRTALELSLNSALDTLDAMGSELSSTNVDHVFAVLDVLKTLSVARSASGRIHSLYLHRYGPIGDFTRRFRAVAATAPQRVRVTRYGYLSDAKLDAIVRIASDPPSA